MHVPKSDIDDVFGKLSRALKSNGVLYASFKYGNNERKKDGRYFSNYNEENLRMLIYHHKNIKIENLWITEDVRLDCKNDFWMNALIVLHS